MLHGVRGLPLVGIVEFFLYRMCMYFRDRYVVAEQAMVDNQKIYGYKMTEYMEDAFKKALLHHVQAVGAVEHRFEVTCRDKGRLGGRRERHTQGCALHNHECVCSYQKPKLLHRPCTHVDRTPSTKDSSTRSPYLLAAPD